MRTQQVAQLGERAVDSFPRGVFAQADDRANFAERSALEKPQQNRFPIARTQSIHRGIKDGPELGPVRGSIGVGFDLLHVAGLLFARATTLLAAHDVDDGVARRGVKPATEHRLPRNTVRVARECTEHKLRDILRVLRVAAEPAKRGGIHKRQMASHDLGKRLLVPSRGIPSK